VPVAVVVEVPVPAELPPQASRSAGPTVRLPAAMPACLRNSRRSHTGDQPDAFGFL